MNIKQRNKEKESWDDVQGSDVTHLKSKLSTVLSQNFTEKEIYQLYVLLDELPNLVSELALILYPLALKANPKAWAKDESNELKS